MHGDWTWGGKMYMLTACWFAIDKEYPKRVDTTGTPLDAALVDFLYRRVLLGIRRRWLLD